MATKRKLRTVGSLDGATTIVRHPKQPVLFAWLPNQKKAKTATAPSCRKWRFGESTNSVRNMTWTSDWPAAGTKTKAKWRWVYSIVYHDVCACEGLLHAISKQINTGRFKINSLVFVYRYDSTEHWKKDTGVQFAPTGGLCWKQMSCANHWDSAMPATHCRRTSSVIINWQRY